MTEPTIFTREAERLGIRIPRSAWKAAGHSASKAMQERGVLFSHGGISDWLVEELRQVEDEVVCLGPGFDGLSLEEMLRSTLAETDKIDRLAAVARALYSLVRESSLYTDAVSGHDNYAGLPPGIRSQGILVSGDREVLILPSALISRACTRTQKVEALRSEGHPAEEASVLLAGILRRIVLSGQSGQAGHTGPNETTDEDYHRKEKDPFVPLGLIAPELDPRLTALADRARTQPGPPPPLKDWVKAFDETAGNSYRRELAPEELARLAQERSFSETRVRRIRARRHFFSKWGSPLSALALVLAVLSGILIFDRPPPGPDLSKLSPKALVRTYYEAINSLDLATLEACLDGKAGKDDRNLISQLTVVTRMRQAYSPEAPYILAQDWTTAGSPELAEGAMVYGITGLEIRPLPFSPAGQSAPENRFESRYILWTTGNIDNRIQVLPIERKDKLTLREGRKGWKITMIEREQS